MVSIFTFPNEVLVEILKEACIHSFPDCRHIPAKDLYRFSPLSISHVSTRFRQLVLNTKTLWTCIHVMSELADTRTAKLVDLFLSRSADLPITITVVRIVEEGATPEQDPFDWPAWRLLASQVHRWENAALHHFHDDGFSEIYHTIAHAPLPLLRTLSISVHPRDLLEKFEPMTLTFAAPALTKLRLRTVVPSFETLEDIGTNLKYLVLSDMLTDSRALMSVLPNCEALTTLILGPAFYLFVGIRSPPVHLPSLQHLALTDLWDGGDIGNDGAGGNDGWSYFLKKLVTPNLSYLAVEWGCQWDFLAYVERCSISFPTVRRLKVFLNNTRPGEDGEVPSPFLQAFPALEELYLGRRVADDVLKAATSCQNMLNGLPGKETQSLWPSLRELSIKDSWASGPSILEFMQHRAPNSQPINLRIEDPLCVNADDLKAIKDLGVSVLDFDFALWHGQFSPEDLEELFPYGN